MQMKLLELDEADMNKHKVTLVLIALVLTLCVGVGTLTHPASAQAACGIPGRADLMGGYDGAVDYGDISIWNTSTTLYSQFTTKSGWYISEIYYHPVRYYSSIPKHADGTFDYSAFAYHTTYSAPYPTTITLNSPLRWAAGSELSIAARVTVVQVS